MRNIPLFDLNYDIEETNAVLEVLKTKWISSGPKVNEFEAKFSEMIGTKYALAVSSCTGALHLALTALGIGMGDEVLVPSMTFVATVNAIRYLGATPVFCDVESYDRIVISPDEIKEKVTPKTKAILVMHYAGYSCDMDRIMQIADDNNIEVLEDACHAPMTEYKGKKVGGIGKIGCFSFFSNKNISTGEGGMLVTNDKEIFEKAKLLRSHGMTTSSYERSKGHSFEYDVVELGYNYRMDDIRASLGIAQLKKLNNDIERRKKIREKYIDLLGNNKCLTIPFAENTDFSSNYLFPIVLNNGNKKVRNHVREELKKKGIQTSVHYPAVHKFKIYEMYSEKLPITEYISDCELTLPMYGHLEFDDIDYICKTVNEITERLYTK